MVVTSVTGSRNREGPAPASRPIAFTAFVRYVRQPTAEMPPYTSKVVSDQELADIYAYLQSIPAPPSANNIPLQVEGGAKDRIRIATLRISHNQVMDQWFYVRVANVGVGLKVKASVEKAADVQFSYRS